MTICDQRPGAGADTLPPANALARLALFFDLDGTLVPIAPTPEAVEVSAVLRERLGQLVRAVPGRVAILSGRSIETLDILLGPVASTIALAGSHGAELRLPGKPWIPPLPVPEMAAASAELAAVAAAHDLLFEQKPLGAALHYRLAPNKAAFALDAAERIARTHQLVFQRGKMVAEVRMAGDKGQALAALIATPTMAGCRPMFFGDDVTDEDGFAAAAQAGGAGVLVGEPRATAAAYRLADPAAVLAWIGTALDGANA